MGSQRVAVIGGGVAGLAAAAELAFHGVEVVLCEAAPAPGGKMRELEVGGARIDAGPTVLTMRWVFDELFDAAGAAFDREVALEPADILARHAWSEEERLDLYADPERSADAIGRFAGAAAAEGYRAFGRRAREVFETLEGPFLRSARPSPLDLVRGVGLRGLPALWRIQPFVSLWRALGRYFPDPRLRQLFGRYATYVGASPFQAPATLMLVAHVEQEGVWLVGGGMHRVALALADLARRHGARLRFGAEVARIELAGGRAAAVVLADGERIGCAAVVCNADVAALAGGRFGADVAARLGRLRPAQRSLSALTWSLVAETRGFPLLRHNVFFSSDYAAEFDDVFGRRRLPEGPTVYVCAQDREAREGPGPGGPERLLCLVNAPAEGDARVFEGTEVESCEQRTFERLSRCGLVVDRSAGATLRTTPTDFDRRFPATGGALYGEASHGWQASFRRPGARSPVPGLYLAGGSVHPGPGVPMAALSGRAAAAAVRADLASTSTSRPAATAGGTSTG